MRTALVDPSAYTLPYDHALAMALARLGAEVELITSRFVYGDVPIASGYVRSEEFYRHAHGAPGSVLRRFTKLGDHVGDMRRLRGRADVTHFQWLAVQWLDSHLLPPGPVVVTAHDLLPREPRPGQARAQRRLYDRVDAIIAHSEYGRGLLVDRLGVDQSKVHVIHHGAFDHLTEVQAAPLPDGLEEVSRPVVLFFGLLRPYKGLETLLSAWHGVTDAELWVVGRPRMPVEPLRALADASVRFVPRFVSDAELPAFFTRAEVVVLPYSRTERLDFSGVLAAALAFGKPIVLTDVGGFSEVAALGAARLVAADDPEALREALVTLISDAEERARLGAAAARAATGTYSWAAAAQASLALYESLL
jgi:glycosyltransferase involved in cell wall biosynthesis